MTRYKTRWLPAAILWLALWPAVAHSQSAAFMDAYSRYSELYAQGHYEEALSFAKKALQLGEEELGLDDPAMATVLNNLAVLYKAQGRYAEAEPLYQRSLAIDENATTAPQS